jgi:hypothetical protein
VKLQPDFVGLETVAGQARPFERVLAFLLYRQVKVKRFRTFPLLRLRPSFAGSCFSSGSALWPSHNGVRMMK